ncbi:vWA domain-containing protein [Methylobacter sp. G7]|uniref:vWA domain-containing protein n=1 Tax=Methylobacter sp. G7 TaxID=3230117 RepID=UPI003D804770
MNWAVDTPWALTGLLLALLPMFNNGMRSSPAPWTALIPRDTLSVFIVCCLRLCAMAAIAGLVLGMAGLHRTEQRRERIGHGAHIVLLLDRSSSMDNSFAGRAPNGVDDGKDAGGRAMHGAIAEESKATAARRLLTDFVKQRQTDLIGVAEYSTSPLFVMPLTENKNAVQAAIAATATPALGFTHVSKGLGMAISFFEQQPVTGSRIVLLVSDGAAAIDHDSEQKLRLWFKQQQVRLYWIFLRTAGSPGIFDQPEDSRDDNAQAMPELYLHKFFLGLGSPYQAYEAESPDALKQAIADINQLENLPMHYFERIPKQDLSAVCYSVAAFLLLVLFGVKFCEVER